jgi:hypothetical protein
VLINIFKKNWLLILLYIVGFLYTFATLSSRFDGDFGWQLRFGQDVLSGHFPYLDTYTWAYYGHPWTNHEWGGSVLWWIIFHYGSYNLLVIFVSLVVWTTFVFVTPVFKLRLSPASLICSLIGIVASNQVLYTRLTVVAPAFFLLLVYTLERIPEKKYYWWWPLLFWVWAALHGSWILGFIVIGIYFFGKLVEPFVYQLSNRYFTIGFKTQPWNKAVYISVAIAAVLSALTIIINPYGISIWREVLLYFTQNTFMTYVTEWQPSYAYPVFLMPLAVSAVAIAFALYATGKRQLTLPQVLLFFALQYAGFTHRRNVVYAILILVPLLYAVLEAALEELKKNTAKKIFVERGAVVIGIISVLALVAPAATLITWHKDVWSENNFLQNRNMPALATLKLRTLAEKKSFKLYNRFSWGGYLNWQLPNVLVYLDGRGTATWSVMPTSTLYEDNRKLMYSPGGLPQLERLGVTVILLQQPTAEVYPPNWFNKLIFDQADLRTVTVPAKSELELSLDAASRWKKVYSDSVATIWQFSTTMQ